MDPLSDAKIVDSWRRNASPWTTAVRERQIESRRLVTDNAIVAAVMSRSPASVLDIGCGEGWLVRSLAAERVRGIGVDVVPELVAQAAAAGGGEFRVASFEMIAKGEVDVKVDIVVANFSFIGKESVENVVRYVPALLNPGGALIVQTLHPLMASGDSPYRDGWQTGSWAGFSTDFTDPAPWYSRTMESWVALFVSSGLRLRELREPMHPVTGKPASVIFVVETSG